MTENAPRLVLISNPSTTDHANTRLASPREFQPSVLAPRCALANAAANIQVHGGMGFTAECDAHLYLLRAHLLEHLGGPARLVRARLVESVPPVSF